MTVPFSQRNGLYPMLTGFSLLNNISLLFSGRHCKSASSGETQTRIEKNETDHKSLAIGVEFCSNVWTTDGKP